MEAHHPHLEDLVKGVIEQMKAFIQPLFLMVLYALVRSGDLAISAAIARSTIRAICYGIVAVFALLIVALTLLGL
jgi:hypothetical protein